MKKTVLGILTLAVVLSACAATAFAAGSNGTRNPSECSNNGVCSNPSTSCVYTDADENGICDVRETKSESGTAKTGKAFIDEDGDGVCDRYIPEKCKGDGTGCKAENGCQNGFRGGRNR